VFDAFLVSLNFLTTNKEYKEREAWLETVSAQVARARRRANKEEVRLTKKCRFANVAQRHTVRKRCWRNTSMPEICFSPPVMGALYWCRAPCTILKTRSLVLMFPCPGTDVFSCGTSRLPQVGPTAAAGKRKYFYLFNKKKFQLLNCPQQTPTKTHEFPAISGS